MRYFLLLLVLYPSHLFGKLRNQEFIVEKENLEIIKKHIKTFSPWEPNEVMINRLQQALDDKTTIHGADACFYFHELKEAELMGTGYTYSEAHAQAINDYDVSPFSLYHPDVIVAYPDDFNSSWKKHWGIQ